MFTSLKLKPRDVISQMTLPPSGFSLKPLRNAHSLVARIYEKDPQTLKDTITEVEKLSAVQ